MSPSGLHQMTSATASYSPTHPSRPASPSPRTATASPLFLSPHSPPFERSRVGKARLPPRVTAPPNYQLATTTIIGMQRVNDSSSPDQPSGQNCGLWTCCIQLFDVLESLFHRPRTLLPTPAVPPTSSCGDEEKRDLTTGTHSIPMDHFDSSL